MKNYKLAAIQLDTIPGEVNYNVHKSTGMIKQALDNEAEYVFLHEGLTADYTDDPIKYGRTLEGVEVAMFCDLAQRYNAYLALGLNEIWEEKPFLSMVLIGPEGIIDVYRKTYLWPNKTGKDLEKFIASYVPEKSGYRLEKGVLTPGEGTKIVKFGDLCIGCIICADGKRDEAWDTFRKDRPDLIFWQNNRSSLFKYLSPLPRSEDLKIPMVVTNRCGFSYMHFCEGGSCFIDNKSRIVAKANEDGKEEIIYCLYNDLVTE